MTELDGILALLAVGIVVLIWVATELRKLRDAVEPLANSRLVSALSQV